MTAPFAALEARLNTTVFARMANATVTLAGASVTAIFDKAYTSAGVGAYGMAGTAPALTLATASVPADPVGLAAVVGGVSYTVVAHEPDGTGVSVLLLETA